MTIHHTGYQPKPVKLPKPCTYCGSIGHSAFNCPKKPRKAMQSRTPMKQTKPMKKRGKKAVTQWKACKSIISLIGAAGPT